MWLGSSCTHTYAVVTGNSAKIFDKLGHTLLKVFFYFCIFCIIVLNLATLSLWNILTKILHKIGEKKKRNMFNPLIICGFTVWFLSWNITARCKILIVTDPLNYRQDIVGDIPPLMFFLNLFNLNLNKTQRMCQAVNYADFKDNHGELYLKVNKNIIELEIKCPLTFNLSRVL